jgi:hypothetical protein
MLVAVGICYAATASSAPAQHADAKAKQAAKYQAMVESLANRNPAPEVVKLGYAKEPFFPRDHDWDEDHRVAIAFAAIVRDPSPELWEELVKREDDNRYSITMRDNGPNAHNYSVAHLCGLMARQQLGFASRWHTDPDSHDRPDIYLDLGLDDLAKWRAERAAKSLYELQLEVCERALATVNAAPEDKVPGRAKPVIRKTIHAWMEQLRRTKRPLFFKLFTDGFEHINAAEGARLREEIERSRKR